MRVYFRAPPERRGSARPILSADTAATHVWPFLSDERGRLVLDFFAARLAGVLEPATTLPNARSNSSLVASAPISRAISMKRFDCSGSSGASFGLRGI